MFLRSSVLRAAAPWRSQSAVRLFSVSACVGAKKSVLKIRARERREINELKQRYISEKNANVDPVLGLPDVPFLARLEAEVREPGVLGRGYEQQEVDKLFYGAHQVAVKDEYTSGTLGQVYERQREAVLRILSMSNRSEEEIVQLKVKLAQKEFARFEGDTGSSEVQAAIATVKIQHLYKHCQENKKDFQNVRLLRMLVQKRQRILRYLKRDQPERYYWAINKLGLTDHIVHMEFNLDRRYMQKFKMYGDRVLIRESKAVKEEERKQKRKEKKILKNKSVKELRTMKKALDRATV